MLTQSANHAGMKLEISVGSDHINNRAIETTISTTKMTSDTATCAKSAICPLLGTVLLYEQIPEPTAKATEEGSPVVLMGSTQTQVHIVSENNE